MVFYQPGSDVVQNSQTPRPWRGARWFRCASVVRRFISLEAWLSSELGCILSRWQHAGGKTWLDRTTFYFVLPFQRVQGMATWSCGLQSSLWRGVDITDEGHGREKPLASQQPGRRRRELGGGERGRKRKGRKRMSLSYTLQRSPCPASICLSICLPITHSVMGQGINPFVSSNLPRCYHFQNAPPLYIVLGIKSSTYEPCRDVPYLAQCRGMLISFFDNLKSKCQLRKCPLQFGP